MIYWLNDFMDLGLKEFKTSFHQILQQGSKKLFNSC